MKHEVKVASIILRAEKWDLQIALPHPHYQECCLSSVTGVSQRGADCFIEDAGFSFQIRTYVGGVFDK
jgi:hypothetical protein